MAAFDPRKPNIARIYDALREGVHQHHPHLPRHGRGLPSQAREVMKRHTPYTGCNAGITHFHADPHGRASICKAGRQEQIDLMAEGAEGLRKLAAIGDRMTTRHGGCAGCTLQTTCGTCMPLATLYRQASAPLETYCQHGSSGPIFASPTGGR